MGCWNATCMISHLPIEYGDKIKLVILKGSRKKLSGGTYCYSNGILSPAFLAIEGTYDDYGGIENIEKDWNYDVIFRYMKDNFKSIKVGGKEKKDFSLEDVLEGIERDSLEIYQELDKERVEMAKKVVETYEKKGGFSSPEVEKEWRDIANTDTSFKWRKSELCCVMIRKDVWDEICNVFVGEFYNDEAKSVDDKDFCLTAREWCKRKFEKTLEHSKSLLVSKSQLIKFNEVFFPCYAGSECMLAANEYSKFLFEKGSNKGEILKHWTESVIIESILNHTRRGWMIQPGGGSQSTCFENHLELCNIIEKICKDNLKKYEENE